jgi:hypothetical protein
MSTIEFFLTGLALIYLWHGFRLATEGAGYLATKGQAPSKRAVVMLILAWPYVLVKEP